MDDWKTATKLVHAGARRSQYGEMSEAIFLTQGFVYDSAEQAEARFQKAGDDEFIYARYGNPTVRMFEERIAAIEGTEDAFATASGMAAVNGALTALLKAGDHVVSARALFGSCLYVLEILARFGVEVTLVDGTDLDAWRKAVRPDTRALFLETVSNPTLEVIDLRAVAEIGHAVGATVIVDNVFATPAFSQAVAEALDTHPKLDRVLFPGLTGHPQHGLAMDQIGSGGTVVSFEVRGGQAAAFRFLNALRLIKISNSLGDAKSIVTHPATTTHQRLPDAQKVLLGITPGLVRLSLGIEDPEDILGDLVQALAQT